MDLFELKSKVGESVQCPIEPAISGSLADLIFVSPKYGLVVICICEGKFSKLDERRIHDAVDSYSVYARSECITQGLLLIPGDEIGQVHGGAKRIAVSIDAVLNRSWNPADNLRTTSEIAEDRLQDIQLRIFPKQERFAGRIFSDTHLEENEASRIELDNRQTELARMEDVVAMNIDGGAGSGKTLILLERARWLAARFSDWKILLLCYNDKLALSLSAEIVGIPQVTVETFRQVARRNGVRIEEFTDSAKKKNSENIQKAILGGKGKNSVDAVLIDEGQDFSESWLEFCFSWLTPNRGGLVMTSDPSQGVYELSENNAVKRFMQSVQGSNLEVLDTSYRTTRQILEGAILATGSSHPGWKKSVDGENIQLIYASNLAKQAEVIAWEINNLVNGEMNMNPGDIAVLFPTRFELQNNLYSNALTQSLDKFEIPYVSPTPQNRKVTAAASVTISTIHSAKGLDFSAVFVLGVEKLKVGDSPKAANFRGIAAAKETIYSRQAYVALTRARNILMLTYTKPNAVIGRLLQSGLVDHFEWPSDYPGE